MKKDDSTYKYKVLCLLCNIIFQKGLGFLYSLPWDWWDTKNRRLYSLYQYQKLFDIFIFLSYCEVLTTYNLKIIIIF